jgi:hypothetical protein
LEDPSHEGEDSLAFQLLKEYAAKLKDRFNELFQSVSNISLASSGNSSGISAVYAYNLTGFSFVDKPSVREMQEFILSLILSEIQGGIRTTVKFFDFPLIFMSFNSSSVNNENQTSAIFDESLRFRLGIGLSKLGLYDLSLKHLSGGRREIGGSGKSGLSSFSSNYGNWQSPFYRLRSKLLINTIHSSIGSLAIAINNFEKNIESILLSSHYRNHHHSTEMTSICNSPNEAALAFQSLPLLHLLGYSSPRIGNSLGHSPIPLSYLLSEVYLKICPLFSPASEEAPSPVYSKDEAIDIVPERQMSWSSSSVLPAKKKIRLGIVSGTFDGLTGRLMIGLFAGLSDSQHLSLRSSFEIVALCFPTPRSIITDRVISFFDSNINLSPENRTQIISRILAAKFDFLLFMDASLDTRVFTLAHERLAPFQGLYWTYGSSLGIPSIDYYFIPEIFFSDTKCPKLLNDFGVGGERSGRSGPGGGGSSVLSSVMSSSSSNSFSSASASLSHYNSHLSSNYHLPQELFSEQVLFLSGIPFVPRLPALSPDELRSSMKAKYLLEITNRTNLYLLPVSVKNLHPEFDKSLEVILRSDPHSMIIITIPRSGRDILPPQHIAIRHDLMHPSMPIAAIMKVKRRFSFLMKDDYLDRIHILPSLDEGLFRALQQHSIAVLDTYPIGLHVPVLEAILDGVPVISLPFLQECLSSFAINIQKSFNISYYSARDQRSRPIFFTTAEEYGVLAVRLSKDTRLRNEMIVSSEVLSKLARTSSDPLIEPISSNFSKKDGKSPSSSMYSTNFTQYYHENHHFVQILKFITNLKYSFTV